MKNTLLLDNLSRSLHKVGFQLKKHSPAILVGAGIVGVVASTVMACKATTKANDILENSKKQLDDIKAVANDEVIKASGEYTEKDQKKDLTIVYTKTGLDLVKLYAPAAALGVLSITSILVSHNILHKRNVALAAAYTVVDSTFKDYRKRVVDRFGKRIDHELRYNIKAEQVETIDIDENGNEKVEKKTIEVADINTDKYSDFARFFDELNPNYKKDPSYNLWFLKSQETWANQKLQKQGYLFLNDVYEALGFPKVPAGQVNGWVYDKNNPIGDNFVDFGLYDVHKKGSRDFVNGYEPAILIDFNIDGNVLKWVK